MQTFCYSYSYENNKILFFSSILLIFYYKRIQKLQNHTSATFWTFTMKLRWFYIVLLFESTELISYNFRKLLCSVFLTIYVNGKNNDFSHYCLFWVRLKYLPGPRDWLITAHLFPILSCKSNKILSSWIVQSSRHKAGSRWLLYLNVEVFTFPCTVFLFLGQNQTVDEAEERYDSIYWFLSSRRGI
jgi:hypothetical protein